MKFSADFIKKRIGVVGDLMLDRYIWGEVERVSPEAPTPVVILKEEKLTPGGAANVASNVAALGAHAVLFGAVGNDAAGRLLLQELLKHSVDIKNIVKVRRSTTEKTRVIARSQQIVRLDKEDNGEFDSGSRKTISLNFSEAIGTLDAVVISDYDKGVVSRGLTRTVLRLAAKHQVPVIAAPKPLHFSFFRGVRVIVPNKKETEGIIGKVLERENDLLDAGKVLAKRSAAPILITRGKDGMSLFENGSVRHIPSAAREVYDVTGAGDTVAAGLALGLACGMPLYGAAVLANAAAGIVVGKRGTATVTVEELHKALTTKVTDGRQLL